jgi:hypothetical protein
LTVFHRAKILEPIKPLLLLPEVVDTSGWFEGKHHYDDPENRYIFVFEGTPRSGKITYNTKLVNPSEIKSYWDLLNPKWKGKIVRGPLLAGDRRGADLSSTPNWGQEICGAHAETDMVIVRPASIRLLSGKIRPVSRGAGRYNGGIAAQSISADRKGSSAAYNGAELFNRAPHPNAAKVANCCCRRKGQTTARLNQKTEDQRLPEGIFRRKVLNGRAR